MAWKRFNEKSALPRDHRGNVELTVLKSGPASFKMAAWQGAVGKTHAVYHIDEENKRVGIELINLETASEADISMSYKIQWNGVKQITINCTRFLQYMPFPLVDMKPQGRRKLESGKWSLNSYEENGLIVMESEVH